jgi:N-acetylneuraminic acid mutarotase
VTDLNRIARYDTAALAWNALRNRGLDNGVYALAAADDDLYVGGSFGAAGDGTLANLNGVARYYPTTTAWGALPNLGLNGEVWALAAMGDDLYVGGTFTQTVDGAVGDLGYIARYDTKGGTWHTLDNEGLNGYVFALAVVGEDLYVGGEFTGTGDATGLNLYHIARYDTTANTWYALPRQGLAGNVYALAVAGDDLYVGGNFTRTWDEVLTNLGNIAHYDTTGGGTWYALHNDGLDNVVRALVVVGDDLYVGGQFAASGDATVSYLNGIARYDTTGDVWYALDNEGLNHYVHALAVVGSDVYVGGNFTTTGDGTVTGLGYIARYDTMGDAWHALPGQGLSGQVWALAAVGSDLYVGGGFIGTGNGMVGNLGYIARYDATGGGTWHALPNKGLNGPVWALAVVGDDLYVGGSFTASGDGTVTNLGNIARYFSYRHWVYLPLVIRQ